MFLQLKAENYAQAKVYADTLGVDITTYWEDDWFNQEVSAQPEYIRLDYLTTVRAQVKYYQ
jgi:hypothetical protein